MPNYCPLYALLLILDRRRQLPCILIENNDLYDSTLEVYGNYIGIQLEETFLVVPENTS